MEKEYTSFDMFDAEHSELFFDPNDDAYVKGQLFDKDLNFVGDIDYHIETGKTHFIPSMDVVSGPYAYLNSSEKFETDLKAFFKDFVDHHEKPMSYVGNKESNLLNKVTDQLQAELENITGNKNDVCVAFSFTAPSGESRAIRLPIEDAIQTLHESAYMAWAKNNDNPPVRLIYDDDKKNEMRRVSSLTVNFKEIGAIMYNNRFLYESPEHYQKRLENIYFSGAGGGGAGGDR